MPVIIPILSTVFGFLGKAVGGIFNLKQQQGDLIAKSIDLINTIQDSEAKAKVAAMTALVAESQSEGWLTRSWRPLAFVGFTGLLFAYFFGYAPSAVLGNDLPPIVSRIFDLIETVLLAGYPARTVEKVMKSFMLNKALMAFVEKKIL